MDEKYAEGEDDGSEMDLDILVGLSLKVINSPEGAQALVAAAKNTKTPAKGTGQFIIMLIENVSKALEDSGIDVDPAAWMASDGAVAEVTNDIIDVLVEGGVEIDPNTFAEELYFVVADMVKGIAQTEEAQSASPTASASPIANAPLLG